MLNLEQVKSGARARTKASGWVLPKQTSSVAPPHVWSNADMDPVPPERRTWTGWVFVIYWFSDLVTVSTWSGASSVVAAGLSAKDAIVIVLLATLWNAIPTVFNGAIGATLHIPFPIAARAVFGLWLSYFAILSRSVLAMFWFGVNTAAGALAVTQMIKAIWPSYGTLANSLPESAGITTQGMISYFIFFVVQTPFIFIPMHKLRPMFLAKAIVMPPMAIAMVAWICVKAGSSDFFDAPSQVSGSTKAWLWLSSLTSVTGSFSTITVNISDFSRFSAKPGSQLWQLPVIPLFKVWIGAFGIISASASAKIWGEALWNPLLIIDNWHGSSGGRAAAFFASACWCLAQICLNISANSLSFANDITSVWPKYINIFRGQVICFLLGGWALCPWLVMASAQTFLSFMSAYAIFMAPLASLLLADYWIVKKRKYDVPALYDPDGIYGKCNWRSLFILTVVILPLLPGLAQRVTPDSVSIPAGMRNLFAINYMYGFVSALVIYLVLNWIWPQKRTLIPHVVYGTPINGVDVDRERHSESDSPHPEAEKSKEAEIRATAI
ncbi:uncharacterized protein HMPREF1541_01544 [Cyphellophora europaea CBS 101466]|uniref:NCS1 nucleoside transporter n=1 Tax=Cyphellophora europaea (strain CBS 101466) TaxID=1220924 RepID=W2S1E6_CYPE1|nr:uncharacterized protein HMPREF1541_01544 [Cyphellophora europaea CBS 101466]ETN42390.1 hypothetical protein HMPREF1541_01544 [Cyphellophora europaea CBS 101466]